MLLAEKANLLILDEPTNDLDVMTLSALESMLLDFGGSVLLVSHDRWLLDRVATGILAFEGDGQVVLHAGNHSEYRERVGAREGEGAAGGSSGTGHSAPATGGEARTDDAAADVDGGSTSPATPATAATAKAKPRSSRMPSGASSTA